MTDFERIYTVYFQDVFRYVLKLSNDEHIAEEITSQTFFKAIKSYNKFRGDCDVRVWLCQIAKNCYFTYIKKIKQIDYIDDADMDCFLEPKSTIEEQMVQYEDIQRIQKILHHFQEPYKEVFMWRVYAELSFKQIGQIFNKTENWACVTYHRARKKIKEKLEVNDDEK